MCITYTLSTDKQIGDLMKTPTVKQLQQSWNDFLKVGIYEDQRFGQWFYNQYSYEVGNSYNIEHPCEAYQVLFNSLTISLNEV